MRNAHDTHPSGLPVFGGPEMFALRPVIEGAPLIDLSGFAIQRKGDRLPWRPKYPTIVSVASHYLHEYAVDNTHDPVRAAAALLEWVNVLGFDFDCRTLGVKHYRLVIDALKARGLAPGSVRRIMAWGSAALHHARREERLDKDPPKLPKIAGGAPRARWLSRQEYQRVMDVPKCERAQRFLVLAFTTGARSRAIETLTWDRVDFDTRTIDYRMPGRDHKNKRRAVVPISDTMLVRLQGMHEKRTDDYVIGLAKSGRPCTTYHHAKALLRSVGIDEYGCARHVARHSVASWMLQGDKERGIPPAQIQFVARMLGDTVAMIDRVYGHLSQEHLREASRVLP